MARKVLIVAEHQNGEVRKTAFEMISAAASIAADRVDVLLTGQGLGDLPSRFDGYAVNTVLTVDDSSMSSYDMKRLAILLKGLLEEKGYDTLMMAAGSHGRETMPYLAALSGTAYIPDVTALRAEGDSLVATHPVYAGKSLRDIRADAAVCMTLRPNAFSAEKGGGSPVQEAVAAAASEGGVAVRELKKKDSARPELTEASIIVSGGRGMGGPEHYPVIEELADLLGAAVGASRAAVDAGWRPHSDQVGQTGKTVSPNLYIACGISGAIQHLAGMSSSKVIVAVNKDPEAPIFKVANYGISGDLFEVVPAIVAELRK